MKAVEIREKDAIGIVEMDAPDMGPTDVLIESVNCGICGTDVHIYRGEYMGAYPVVPGHEFSGIVRRVGDQVSRVKAGDRVTVEPNIACDNCEMCLNNRQNFCRNWQAVGVTRPGAMAEFVVAPEKAVFDIGSLSFEQASFVEPLSCVLHGIRSARIDLADRILIVGAGPIGVLLLKTALIDGASKIDVVDRNRSRLARAADAGARECGTELSETTPDSYDVVIDATGSPTVMEQTLSCARPGGTVLWFGVPPKGRKAEIEPFVLFEKGLHLLSSFTSVRNTLQALRLLQSERITVTELISHRFPLTDVQRGIELIESGGDDVMKVTILPHG